MTRFCGGCGAPRPSAEQRFCAECGTPFDAAAPAAIGVPAPPAPSPAPATPTYATTSAPAPWAPGAGTARPSYDYAEPARLADRSGEPRAKSPVGKIIGVGALVAAVAAGGLVGWQVLGSGGGAETPEAAVQGFVTALVEQDAVAALALVNPGEAAGLDDVYASASDRLRDRGIVGGDRITDALDVSVSGLEFEVHEQGQDVARIELVDGDYTVAYDPAAVPDSLSFVADEEPDPREWSGDIVDDIGWELPHATVDGEHPEPFLSAVRVDGGWYVSLVGTYVDYLYTEVAYWEEWDVSSPDFDAASEEVEPIVGETPEDVVGNLVDAVNSGDVEDLLANLPEDQVRVLRPYARTLQGVLREEGVGFDISVDGLDLETEERGDQVVVTVDRAEVSAGVRSDGSEDWGAASIDGSCLTGTEEDGDQETVCLDQEVPDYLGLDSLRFVLTKTDGGYQVDPLATAIDYATTIIDEAPDSAIDSAIDEICYGAIYEERCYA